MGDYKIGLLDAWRKINGCPIAFMHSVAAAKMQSQNVASRMKELEITCAGCRFNAITHGEKRIGCMYDDDYVAFEEIVSVGKNLGLDTSLYAELMSHIQNRLKLQKRQPLDTFDLEIPTTMVKEIFEKSRGLLKSIQEDAQKKEIDNLATKRSYHHKALGCLHNMILFATVSLKEGEPFLIRYSP